MSELGEDLYDEDQELKDEEAASELVKILRPLVGQTPHWVHAAAQRGLAELVSRCGECLSQEEKREIAEEAFKGVTSDSQEVADASLRAFGVSEPWLPQDVRGRMLSAVFKLAEDNDSPLLEAAVYALPAEGWEGQDSGEVAERLAELISHPTRDVRSLAKTRVWQLEPWQRPQGIFDRMVRLFEGPACDQSVEYGGMIGCIGEEQPQRAADVLIDGLKSGDPRSRLGALEGLSTLKGADRAAAVPHLIPLLDDEETEFTASMILGSIGGDDARRAVESRGLVWIGLT